MEITTNNIPLPYMTKSVTIKPEISSKYPNGYFKEKECRFCKTIFKPVAPSHHYCSDDCAIKAGAESYIFRNYGITLDTYYQIYKEQKGKCYICQQEGFTIKDSIRISLLIDHDHMTGKVRGLLCPNCNRALGLLKDDLEYINRAKEYLLKPTYESSIDSTSKLYRIHNQQSLKSKDEIFQIYKDIFENKLRVKEICKKYNITKETKRSIELGKTYKEYLKEYQERATTIQ